ncbi:hypothetical protein [Curtobacterium sp. MCBD17_003]|uniref:hypothetical protein n=1 Tax=Curtobacterium sp. MCBD17_003 TaxID=2175667 RepID=UPI000DA76893|nr:hypothetical protein [Curtobacterium sp. MCBD17_003]WIE54794.1 hypothetical protein DEI88_000905 [Curtobacterium sp. MCBD17_003]
MRAISGWILYTPDGEELLSCDGESVLDDDTFDEPRAEGGSFIDEATDALKIQWATDSELVERVVRERFAWILGPDE